MASQVTELAERTQSVGTRRRSLERWGPVGTVPVLLLALAFGLLALTMPARAATLDVCPGTGTYTTIQSAVNAAAAGDIIHICTGNYNENVDLSGVGGDITLEGDSAVIIWPDSGTAIFVTGGQYPGNITLRNLTASSVNGIAVDFSTGIAGNLVISGSSISDAQFAGLYAGPVTGQVWITNTDFLGNGWAGATLVSERPSADCLVPDDIPLAISLYQVVATGNSIEGINASTSCGTIIVTDSTADDNESDGFLLSSTEPNSAVIVTGSSADENGDPPQGFGSGFRIEAYNLTMHDTSATGNSADGVTRAAQTAGLPSTQGGMQDSSLAAVQENAPIIGPAGGVSLPRTVEISNTSAYSNFNHGINVGAVDLVTITHVSAISNVVDGIRLPNAQELQGTAVELLYGMTGYITGVVAMNNGVGIEFVDNTPSPIPAGQQGFAVADAAGTVAGSIICGNADAGLAATGLISHTYDAGFNYWGSYSGPYHSSKNPSGTGNTVVDSADPRALNNANGDVVFDPWVDSGSSTSIPAVGVLGQTQVVSVVFNAGQAAALASGPGDPNGGPLFTAATNNGVLTSTFGSGSTVRAAMGAGQALTVILAPAVGGTANVTVTGPCGLTASAVFPVVAPSTIVTKSVGLDPSVCAPVGAITATAGSHVYYCLHVTNTGNVTLTDHLVSDPLLGITNVPLTYALPPGASVAITHSLVSGLGPITVTNTITNAATITSTSVLTQFGGVAISPQVQVAARGAGVVTVRVTPTGLEPIAEPIRDKRVFLPALGR